MQVTDKIQITNEDNMLLMARYPDKYFDLAIVDPPYGIKAGNVYSETSKVHGKSNAPRTAYKIQWDNSIPTDEYFAELFRVSKNQIIWGGNYFTNFLKPSSGWIAWKKRDVKLDFNQLEFAWTSNLKTGFADILWSGYWQPDMKNKQKRIHPTEKPYQLYKWLLENYAKQGNKILDTHLGSGSIAIACHDYKFDLTACELDKEYFDKAIQRINNHTAQTKLF